MKPTIKFRKLAHFCGDLPEYQTVHASGCDVRASVESSIVLKPGDRALVPTGLSLEIPIGFEIQVRARSGLAIKNGIALVNGPGTIDSDYRGELKIILINLGGVDFEIQRGDRIAQLVISPVVQGEFIESSLSETGRGQEGFGSTGI